MIIKFSDFFLIKERIYSAEMKLIDAINRGELKKLKDLLHLYPKSILDKKFYNNLTFGESLMFDAIGINFIEGIIELTKADVNWHAKNTQNKYFLDYANDREIKILKALFPKKYQEYLIIKNTDKYNL
jgi:hypothetical protein